SGNRKPYCLRDCVYIDSP
ncbi:phosphoglucomutase/phosphomannomutase, alpha/beta/alpha domain III family protein, partial [Chlamydia psittaci 84-8471/1]